MSDVVVIATGEREYAVQAQDGQTTSSHLVTVPDELVDALGIGDDDHEELVRESFAFLLEREPPSAILPRFALSDISRFFPEYREEIARRLP